MTLQLLFENDDSGLMTCPNDIRCFACGGRAPYTWTVTKGSLSASKGAEVSVSPPANPGSGVGGTAYKVSAVKETLLPCGSALNYNTESYGCNDNNLAAGVSGSCSGNVLCDGTPCSSIGPACHNTGGGDCTTPNGACPFATGANAPVAVALAVGGPVVVCDQRTPTMITNGCHPCTLEMNGAVVTVTDADGNSVSRGITPT